MSLVEMFQIVINMHVINIWSMVYMKIDDHRSS